MIPYDTWQINNHSYWFDLIQDEKNSDKIKQYAMEYPDLVFAKDISGRVAQNVAHPINSDIMKSLRFTFKSCILQ